MKRNGSLNLTVFSMGLLAHTVVLAASDRAYVNRYEDKRFGNNIVLQGTVYETDRLAAWLDRIAAVPKGRNTLRSIQESGHQLVIQHAAYAVISAGRTRAPMS